MAGTPADEEAQKKADNDLQKRKKALKKDADDTHAFGRKLASKIPQQGGMTVSDFEKWVPGFESGYVGKTPDPSDTPYDLGLSKRPKVRILDRGEKG